MFLLVVIIIGGLGWDPELTSGWSYFRVNSPVVSFNSMNLGDHARRDIVEDCGEVPLPLDQVAPRRAKGLGHRVERRDEVADLVGGGRLDPELEIAAHDPFRSRHKL